MGGFLVCWLVLFAVITTAFCQNCTGEEFWCPGDRCIPGSWICDADEDCLDGSDETDPETGLCPKCPPEMFTCNTGKCIPGRWICDGDNDCGENEDEPDPDQCPPCSDDQFRCNNGKCIYSFLVCNGENECVDWSDEEDLCPCADNEIRCPKPPREEPVPPGVCIPPEYVCDEEGIWDCPNGWDEQNCTARVVGNKRSPRVFVSRQILKYGVENLEQMSNNKSLLRKDKIKFWKKSHKAF